MQKNDLIEIKITDIASDGSGVGRCGGAVVFVPLTAAGDLVRVKILKVKKNCAYARLEEIVSPSPDRTANGCNAFRQCGGCVFRHISYSAELRHKYNKVYECMKRIGGIDLKPQPIIPSPKTEGYRNKAQYPVSPNGAVGFFAPRSHRIIPCGGCALQPEAFGRIADSFSDWIRAHDISVYDETSHRGLIRHLYIRIAEKTDEIMVCAVINGDTLPFAEDLTARLKSVCGDALKSLQYNINRENTNVILGSECRVVYGQEFITDILCGLKIRLSPLSFYQVNRSAAEILYAKAAEYASPQGKDILDLYCGAGTIGLSMAGKARSVIGAEIIPEAVKDARFNATLNGIKNAEFLCADAARAAEELALRGVTPGAVIADPPRKGLSPELIKTVSQKISPPRIVYISCDPATLARDAKLFTAEGYSLAEYTPLDMFPRTAHVETAALFTRAAK